MYKSKEIRWFFKENNDSIALWFSDRGKVFSKTDPRTDFYLPIPYKDDLSVKLREGNIEIKQRLGTPALHQLTQNTTGYLEDWVKWSFDVEDEDELARSIIKDKKYKWIEVYKERLGVKLTTDVHGSPCIIDIKDRIPYGCQIEFTRLTIKKHIWFTFGFEWFGDKYIKVDDKLMNQMFGETKLDSGHSYGYNRIINK